MPSVCVAQSKCYFNMRFMKEEDGGARGILPIGFPPRIPLLLGTPVFPKNSETLAVSKNEN